LLGRRCGFFASAMAGEDIVPTRFRPHPPRLRRKGPLGGGRYSFGRAQDARGSIRGVASRHGGGQEPQGRIRFDAASIRPMC
jgi:hypothetical protein